MAKMTIGFGVLLAIIGVAGRLLLGARLHPLWFGLVLVVCGVLANTENAKQRMLWMHIAVTVGLLGFLIPGVMTAVALAHRHGAAALDPRLLDERILVAVVCLVFTGLCVRSFIAARRNRAA